MKTYWAQRILKKWLSFDPKVAHILMEKSDDAKELFKKPL